MVFHPPTKLGQLGQLTRCGAPHASSMSRRRSCCKQAQSIPWYHGFEIDPVTGTLKISVCTPSQSTSAAIAKLSRCSRICLAIEVFANQQANKFGLQKPAWLVQPQFQKKSWNLSTFKHPFRTRNWSLKRSKTTPHFCPLNNWRPTCPAAVEAPTDGAGRKGSSEWWWKTAWKMGKDAINPQNRKWKRSIYYGKKCWKLFDPIVWQMNWRKSTE